MNDKLNQLVDNLRKLIDANSRVVSDLTKDSTLVKSMLTADLSYGKWNKVVDATKDVSVMTALNYSVAMAPLLLLSIKDSITYAKTYSPVALPSGLVKAFAA